MATLQKITTHFWFDNEAEEAAAYYIAIFDDAEIERITRYTAEGFEIHKRPAGSVMTAEFRIGGQEFVALNGGPDFKFNEAISLVINCGTQEEIDYYWEKLNEGGDPKAQQCGWVKDKFGVSWQVVPIVLADMIADPDEEKASRAMRAMLGMKKLDIAELERAYNG